MKPLNILIAGGNGIIGSELFSVYSSIHSVTSIDCTAIQMQKEQLTLDLTDKNKVTSFADNCIQYDVLIFLVGLAHKKGKGADYRLFEKINSHTLVNLIEALNENNALPDKIIFSSTISVYGEHHSKDVYNEEEEPDPFSPYAVTKLQAEQYLLDNFGNKSWILRFAPVYSSDFLLNIIRRIKIGGRYYKVGNGRKKLSLCNIENIKTSIEGIVDGIVPAGVFNISDPVSYSYNDLLNHQGASFVFRIPILAIRLLYILGRITNNIFLKENSTKLITDNIFPSDKIQKYIKLNSTISDLKFSND